MKKSGCKRVQPDFLRESVMVKSEEVWRSFWLFAKNSDIFCKAQKVIFC